MSIFVTFKIKSNIVVLFLLALTFSLHFNKCHNRHTTLLTLSPIKTTLVVFTPRNHSVQKTASMVTPSQLLRG